MILSITKNTKCELRLKRVEITTAALALLCFKIMRNMIEKTEKKKKKLFYYFSTNCENEHRKQKKGFRLLKIWTVEIHALPKRVMRNRPWKAPCTVLGGRSSQSKYFFVGVPIVCPRKKKKKKPSKNFPSLSCFLFSLWDQTLKVTILS